VTTDASSPRLAVATSNKGKLSEIRRLLAPLPIEVVSLSQLPPTDFPEEGQDYAANAVAKALAVVARHGVMAVADDSGLEVDALGGAPGPLSARYGGPGLDDAGRVDHLLAALTDVPEAERGAQFVCFAALVRPGGAAEIFRGECRGRILPARRGEGGFGYDPIFEPAGHDVSMAELSADEKHAISHRGNAFRALERALAVGLGVEPA